MSRGVLSAAVHAYSKVLVEGAERLPAGPVVLCFNHLDWADPLFFIAALPGNRRLFFFGPEQEDMRHGARNRLMEWAGIAVPFKPGRRGLVAATRRVEEIVAAGGTLAIAGEGRIHARESDVLPLDQGAAYFALRCGIPVVPVAISGTSWLGFRDVVRIRVGEPICPAPGQAVRAAEVEALTAAVWGALKALVAGEPDKRRTGTIGRWLTELFNDWPEGSRPTY